MEEMIKKIIEIDRHAREITEAATAEKLQAEKDISKRKIQLREEYLQRASERLKLLEDQHREITEEAFNENKKKYSEAALKLEELNKANHEKWVDELVRLSLA